MNIIFSRKGLDSSFGNTSSAVLPDGTLAWLPIPEKDSKKNLPSYNNLFIQNYCLGDIVESISKGKLSAKSTVHLDPDIFPFHLKRDEGWFPIFGQTGAAESHLRNHNVSAGDIFLFFSWFRETEYINGKLQYIPNYFDQHILYGWFQIEEKKEVKSFIPLEEWMKEHSHLQGVLYNRELDTVYFPTKYLILDGEKTNLSGCGYFPKKHDEIVLTARGENRSIWELPSWFFPGNEKTPLTYHGNLSRWNLYGDKVFLKTVGRGQEFILNSEEYPQSICWLKNLISSHGKNSL